MASMTSATSGQTATTSGKTRPQTLDLVSLSGSGSGPAAGTGQGGTAGGGAKSPLEVHMAQMHVMRSVSQGGAQRGGTFFSSFKIERGC
jgi:hypothetical protein